LSREVYLLIGPKKLINNPYKTGGVVVLFEDLISFGEKDNLQFDVIDTNKANYNNKLIAYVNILCFLLIKIPRSNYISLHGTANDFLFIAPFAVCLSKIFKKKVALRKFAGNFIEIFNNYYSLQKKIVYYTLKNSDINFFETKYLVDYFKNYNSNTFWFPNVRKKSIFTTTLLFKKRFIFIGSVNREKGIDILCEASNLLPKDYIIDIYGTLEDDYTIEYFDQYHLNYKGTLNTNELYECLSSYDVLVLPSFREGYPGVIIEALSVGLPIVATNLQGIQEMIYDDMSVLVEPGNIIELKDAIMSFNENNYLTMSIKAKKQFSLFDTEVQTRKFFDKLKKITNE